MEKKTVLRCGEPSLRGIGRFKTTTQGRCPQARFLTEQVTKRLRSSDGYSHSHSNQIPEPHAQGRDCRQLCFRFAGILIVVITQSARYRLPSSQTSSRRHGAPAAAPRPDSAYTVGITRRTGLAEVYSRPLGQSRSNWSRRNRSSFSSWSSRSSSSGQSYQVVAEVKFSYGR